MIKHQSVFEPWGIEDKSVQAIITSPPYFGLRKYDIPDVVIGEWKGQYGLEATVELFVEHTLLWAKEVCRVLRDDGVFFLNMGDTYSGMKVGNTNNKQKEGVNTDIFVKQKQDIPSKCKLLIPHRIAIALCDEGWILRNDIIWYKPNAMPESTADRFSKKFEYIFMLTKKAKYYFDLDAVREQHSAVSLNRIKTPWSGHREKGSAWEGMDISKMCHPNGKNPGDVWEITTQASPFKHYAMWPEKLVERMVRCSTKEGDTVLDPFCGSGTTLRIAESLNRKGVGIDLGYKDIQEKRMTDIQRELL